MIEAILAITQIKEAIVAVLAKCRRGKKTNPRQIAAYTRKTGTGESICSASSKNP